MHTSTIRGGDAEEADHCAGMCWVCKGDDQSRSWFQRSSVYEDTRRWESLRYLNWCKCQSFGKDEPYHRVSWRRCRRDQPMSYSRMMVRWRTVFVVSLKCHEDYWERVELCLNSRVLVSLLATVAMGTKREQRKWTCIFRDEKVCTPVDDAPLNACVCRTGKTTETKDRLFKITLFHDYRQWRSLKAT